MRLIPRAKVKCKFCEQVWKTKGRKGTRSRFSFFATFFWLFWILLALVIVWKVQSLLTLNGVVLDLRPVINRTVVEENAEVKTDEKTDEQNEVNVDSNNDKRNDAESDALDESNLVDPNSDFQIDLDDEIETLVEP